MAGQIAAEVNYCNDGITYLRSTYAKQIYTSFCRYRDRAKIADDVTVGPFCYIGSEVVLHSRVQIKSHAVVTGNTEIGQETIVYPFAVVGEIPQDLKFDGEKTSLQIGKRNQIRNM